MIPLFGPVPGGMEMLVILLIAILLFGANKIPKLARSVGKATVEFQRGRQQAEKEFNQMTESPDTTIPESDRKPDINESG